MREICPAHFILFGSIILAIFGRHIQIKHVISFLYPPVSSFLLDPNIPLSTPL
jgi:hypothetical protein